MLEDGAPGNHAGMVWDVSLALDALAWHHAVNFWIQPFCSGSLRNCWQRDLEVPF